MNYLFLNDKNRINIYSDVKGYLYEREKKTGWGMKESKFYTGDVFPFQLRLDFSDFVISFPTNNFTFNFYSFVFKGIVFSFLDFTFPFNFERLLSLEDKIISFAFDIFIPSKEFVCSVLFFGFEVLPDDLYVSYVFKVGENLLCDFGLKNYFSLGKIKSLLRIFDNMSFSVSNSCGKVYFSPFGDSINVLDIKILDYLNNISTKEEFKVLSLFFTNGKG